LVPEQCRVAATPYPAYKYFSLSPWERVGVRASARTIPVGPVSEAPPGVSAITI